MLSIAGRDEVLEAALREILGSNLHAGEIEKMEPPSLHRCYVPLGTTQE